MDTKEMQLILDHRSLTDLRGLVDEIIAPEHAQELAKAAEDYAIWLLRAASYIDSRVYDMQGHDRAVKEQNKTAYKVRKALGYSYPKQDITW